MFRPRSSRITERDIEDAIWDRGLGHIIADWYPEDEQPAYRAWRQFRLPCGVADLVIEHPHSYTIVEIKRDEISERTVGQLARYVGCFRDLLNRYACGLNLQVSACAIAPVIRPEAIDALYGVGDVQGWFIPFDLSTMSLDPPTGYEGDGHPGRSDYAWDFINNLLSAKGCAADASAKERVSHILTSLAEYN